MIKVVHLISASRQYSSTSKEKSIRHYKRSWRNRINWKVFQK